MKNNSFEEIGEVLEKAERILLFPHINVDGDALGSSVALCRALRAMNKKCFVLLEDNTPENISFLEKDYCSKDLRIIEDPQVCVCIDCGDEDRIGKRMESFNLGHTSVCIDHHGTTSPFCMYNYIDPKAAATGELIFKLLKAMNAPIDKEMGEAIFAAITTDTGNFQYSNTSKETHEIVASLYDAGIDSNGVSIEIYEKVSLEKIKIEAKILETLKLVAGGKGAITYVSQKMLSETHAKMSETDGIVGKIRSIAGVEIAVLIKEKEEKLNKASFRAKKIGNVAEICAKYNGGGHEKAAGCTFHCSILEAIKITEEEIIENLEKYDK